MKQKANARKWYSLRTSYETQLVALQQSTAARKRATVERLRTAITTLKEKKYATPLSIATHALLR